MKTRRLLPVLLFLALSASAAIKTPEEYFGFRIGSDKKTNFMIGGEFLGGIGIRGITQVELNMFPRFPIILRSEVTNQPAGTKPDGGRIQDLTGKSVSEGDLGVRAIAQAGYRVTPNLTFFLRGSYQGRTINHAGPGAGAGMTFSW